MRTIDRVKKRFIEEGFKVVLEKKLTSWGYEPKIDGDVEAKLASHCCSQPSKEFSRWSLRLLADKMVELHYVRFLMLLFGTF